MTHPTLLAVLAHPDDESFGMGGTLALYAARGVDVYLVCATRGEVGQADEEHLRGFSSIGEMREAELRCAAGILGLKGVFFLGHRDSGMAGAPENQHPDALIVQPVREVAGEVAAHIRRLRPSVVLTFDPIGGYRHPDHIHIHEATRMAFERAADPAFFPEAGPPFGPGRLYYHTIPHGFLKFGVLLLRILGRDPRRFGQNGDIDLAAIAEVNFPIHARIPIASVRTRKEQAAACHSSQGGGRMGGGLLTRLTRLLDRYETYMRAYPVPASGQRAESDLFA